MKDDLERPVWDDVFIALSFVLSQRSLDPRTKHGAFIVNSDYTILSAGYNSPPRGCLDVNIPLDDNKYKYFKHAEENAIINAAREGIKLKGAVAYVTGVPCELCYGSLINAGISKVVFGPIQSKCVDHKSEEIKRNISVGQKISVINSKSNGFVDVLIDTLFYIQNKCGIDVVSKLKEKFNI